VKSYRLWIGLSILLLTLCGFVVVRSVWDQLHTLYPTPETESAFLKNYTPQRVIEQFRCNLSSSNSGSRTNAAGREFVAHTAEFDEFFAMRSQKWMPLMNALRDDVEAQLVGSGAQILSQSGDSRDGFKFDYKLGNSFGSLKISPLAISSPPPHQGAPLPEGTVDVTARIELIEKWFPKEPGIMRITLTTSIASHAKPSEPFKAKKPLR
jgi:hypothetical protein